MWKLSSDRMFQKAAGVGWSVLLVLSLNLLYWDCRITQESYTRLCWRNSRQAKEIQVGGYCFFLATLESLVYGGQEIRLSVSGTLDSTTIPFIYLNSHQRSHLRPNPVFSRTVNCFDSALSCSS